MSSIISLILSWIITARTAMDAQRTDCTSQLARIAKLENDDELGVAQTRRFATQLQKWIPGLYDSVALKIGRAIADGRISRKRIAEICDVTVDKHRKKELRVPAAGYFVQACKGEWVKAGIPWDEGGPQL